MLRRQHDGRERQADGDIYELAQNYGIEDPALAAALYSQACDEARQSHEPAAVAYRRLLAETAVSPELTPRPLTAALCGEPTQWAAPKPGVSPGKRTRTVTMAEEMAKRQRFTEAQRRANANRSVSPEAAALPGYDLVMSVIRKPVSHERLTELTEHNEPFDLQKTPDTPVTGQRRSATEWLPEPLGSASDPAFGFLAATNNSTAASPPIQGKDLDGLPNEDIDIAPTGSGEPLPDEIRAKMEAALGMDFSAVRIHVGPQAAAVGARAFTHGMDIFFAPGEYEPWTESGHQLLGHELTHVVQQAQGRVDTTEELAGVKINDDAALEQEADAMGALAVVWGRVGATEEVANVAINDVAALEKGADEIGNRAARGEAAVSKPRHSCSPSPVVQKQTLASPNPSQLSDAQLDAEIQRIEQELAAASSSSPQTEALGQTLQALQAERAERRRLAPELDRITSVYRRMIADARRRGYAVAADNLQRFLDGTGGTKTISVPWLRGFTAVTSAEETNQERFASSLENIAPEMSDGETRSFRDHWDRRLTGGVTTELYYASGTSTLTSTGVFTLSRGGSVVTVSGSVQHHWWDPYDWHAGLTAYIPGHGSISDSDALLLQRYRGARPFHMEADWSETVSGTITIDDFLWFDSTELRWSGP